MVRAVLTGEHVKLPGRAVAFTEAVAPVVGLGAVFLGGSPDVVVSVGVILTLAALLEPDALVGGMVQHLIHDHTDAHAVLYDGLIQDMPESVSYILKAEDSVTDKLHYEVTAYLDTGIGNAYQNKSLAANFYWWIEEDTNLLPPQTGDRTPVVLLTVLAGISLVSVILLLQVRRKEDRADGR